jgi:hypothetical protein
MRWGEDDSPSLPLHPPPTTCPISCPRPASHAQHFLVPPSSTSLATLSTHTCPPTRPLSHAAISATPQVNTRHVATHVGGGGGHGVGLCVIGWSWVGGDSTNYPPLVPTWPIFCFQFCLKIFKLNFHFF